MKQRFALVFSILLALGLAPTVQADERSGLTAPGFYGGVSVRDPATGGGGMGFAAPANVWNRYVAPAGDDSGSRTLVFGGYRWRNEVAVEAAFSSVDQYALRPADPATGRRAVGLSLVSGTGGIGEAQSRSWNLDLFTSWTFYKAFALYGRLGYAQSDTTPVIATGSPVGIDRLRLRDGMNYGVGLRYDMNAALGLRLEYGRFGRLGRFAGDSGSVLPDSDQVSFGVQFRF